MSGPRLVGLHVDHHRDGSTRVFLTVDRGLRSGKLDKVPLTKVELAKLVVRGSAALLTLHEKAEREANT